MSISIKTHLFIYEQAGVRIRRSEFDQIIYIYIRPHDKTDAMIQVYLSDTETHLGLANSCHNEKDYATAHFHMKMATVAFAKVMAYLFRPSLHANISAENLYPAVRHLMKFYKDAINLMITKNAGDQSRCDKLDDLLSLNRPQVKDSFLEYNLQHVRFFERSIEKLPVEIPCGDITKFLNKSAIAFGVYLERFDTLLYTDLSKQLDQIDTDPNDESLRELRLTVITIAAEVATAFSALYSCTVISLNDGEKIGKKSDRWYGGHYLSEFAPIRSYPSSSVRIQYNYISHLLYSSRRLARLAGYEN